MQKEIEKKISDSYAEFNEDNYAFLEIVYKIEDIGADQDLDKRQRLENKMVIYWVGLGHTIGGSHENGTMDVGCLVVDLDIAKKLIEENLKDTEFRDYSKIFKMSEE